MKRYIILWTLLLFYSKLLGQFVACTLTEDLLYMEEINPFSGEIGASVPYLWDYDRIGPHANGLVYFRDTLYLTSGAGWIIRHNPETYFPEVVTEFHLINDQPVNSSGLATNGVDSFYNAVNRTNGFLVYDYFTNNYSHLENSQGYQFRSCFYYQDYLYAMNKNTSTLDKVSLVSGEVVESYLSQDTTFTIFTMSYNPYHCEEFSIILTTLPDPSNAGVHSFYEFIPRTGDLTLLSNIDVNLSFRFTPGPGDYDCTLLVDSDKDNSGNLLPYHFRHTTSCRGGEFPITDEDPYVYSTVGYIDSIVVELDEGVLDPGEEYLRLEAGADYTSSASEGGILVIYADSFEGYENALKNMTYFHAGVVPSAGERTIKIVAHRLERESEPAYVYIPLIAGKQAGEDSAQERCADGPVIDLSSLLSDEADAGGEWQMSEPLDVSVPGNYILMYIHGEEAGCPADSSIHEINILEYPEIEQMSDTALCGDMSILLGVDAVAVYTYEWNTGATSSYIDVTEAGEYTLTIRNGICSVQRIVNVEKEEAIELILEDEVEVCEERFVLQAWEDEGLSYRWNNGVNLSSLEVVEDDLYTVEISRGACTVIDSSYVKFYRLPEIDLGEDVTTCSGSVDLTLPLLPEGALVLWEDGSSGLERTVSESGNYTVEVMYGPCNALSEVSLTVLQLNEIDLGSDTIVCASDGYLLQVPPGWEEILWNTGETTASKLITESSNYSVEVRTDECFSNGEVYIEVKECMPCPVYIPNAVSANRDDNNDELKIFCPCAITQMELRIFDRWGQLVYQTDRNEIRWPVFETATGVYVATFRYFDNERGEWREKAQDITVLR